MILFLLHRQSRTINLVLTSEAELSEGDITEYISYSIQPILIKLSESFLLKDSCEFSMGFEYFILGVNSIAIYILDPSMSHGMF